ncbi:phage tail assembly chaperone [Janthinobacterium sp. PSPC3-1]|uniref:phage tail assembly chaperone n=1 Tax=Janthinobacterium sp. PSPC3-1 TaxID=2804653 RepID=UPI003CF583C7
MRYAGHQFERGARAADGHAKGEHLDAARRHPLYRAPPEAEAPPLPFELAHVWEWFVQLNRKRQNGMAVNPIASTEILAWQARHRLAVEPFEHQLLDSLDALFLSHQHAPG